MKHVALTTGLTAVLSLAFTVLPLVAQQPKAKSSVQVAGSTNWAPVDPAELAMTDGKVEAHADAEALLWDIRVTDGTDLNVPHTAYRYHVRIKIFTDRGRDQWSSVTIPFGGDVSVSGIAARTIRANGTIEELKPADVLDRTVATVGTFSVRAKTFVLPGVEKGSIIEYRYTELHERSIANNLTLLFQHDIPVERAVYHIRPLALPGVISGMKAQWYHATPVPFTREADGYMMTSQTNLAAFHPEPNMPPAVELQPSLFIFYISASETNMTRNPAEYWPAIAKLMYGEFRPFFAKTPGDVMKAAAPVKAAASLDDKIAAALEIARAVQPVTLAAPALRLKYKPDQTYEDAFKRGVGTDTNIRNLFAALLVAAGVDVRPARAGNRASLFMRSESANASFLQAPIVVVRAGGDFRYVDPVNRFSGTGAVPWFEEGEPVLVGGDRDGGLARIPLSAAAASLKTRTARLTLREDGSIEGDLAAETSGHYSMTLKAGLDDLSPADREKGMVESFKSTMPGAEITGMALEGLDTPAQPFTYHAHIKMAGYAQRTGSRMFVRPAVFEFGDTPVFPAANRIHPIYFSFPSTEHDTVTLTLPPGYTFDDAAMPAPIALANHFVYRITAVIAPDRHQVVFTRSLVICGGDTVLFAPENYPGIKQFFDGLAAGDGFALTVRKTGGQ